MQESAPNTLPQPVPNYLPLVQRENSLQPRNNSGRNTVILNYKQNERILRSELLVTFGLSEFALLALAAIAGDSQEGHMAKRTLKIRRAVQEATNMLGIGGYTPPAAAV
jgi:hypothetical protein